MEVDCTDSGRMAVLGVCIGRLWIGYYPAVTSSGGAFGGVAVEA